MSVEAIKVKLDNRNNSANKIKVVKAPIYNKSANSNSDKVSFTGGFGPSNVIIGLMDFIEKGGYPASFILQDGTGFIAPRMYKGLMRGGKKKLDEDGNIIYDKNGEPKRELNWAFARKEGIREIITGPSAFLIPLVMLKGITKKFGRSNNVKLNYIDGFKTSFIDYANENKQDLINGNASKSKFYKRVYTDVIEQSINAHIPEAEKLSAQEVSSIAEGFANTQFEIETIKADKSLSKAVKKEKLKALESKSIVDAFIKLRKSKIGGKVNELAAEFLASDGKTVKSGSIGELINALGDYADDAIKSLHNELKSDKSVKIEKFLKNYTNRKMGTRLLTNVGLFLSVAAFYTQIPKLYNLGTHGVNPALANEDDNVVTKHSSDVKSDASKQAVSGKDVSFGGGISSYVSKAGKAVFNNKNAKSISDIFEFNGPVIGGNAMAVLLYGACIPPRITNAQDKYDLGEIIVRDMTAFTALLFGAKALSRLFSDGFTKLTGLALNNKNLEGRKWYQKALDYLNPSGSRHSVLSSKQLDSKYTNIHEYRGGIEGFIEFIEQSGGNIKKALKIDKNIKSSVAKILEQNGLSFESATANEIKSALISAHKNDTDLIKELYSKFNSNNRLLRAAKTCNSTFDFLSTIVLVPGLIIALTDICKKMTETRRAKEKEQAAAERIKAKIPVLIPSSMPTMSGFLNKN